MNLNSISGGIMLAVLAAVWLLVFVPSWASSSEERDDRRVELQEVKQKQKRELSKIQTSPILKSALQARRSKSIKRASGFAALAFLAILAWSLTLIVSSSDWWVWSVASTAGVAISVFVNHIADNNYRSAVLNANRTNARMKFGVSQSFVEASAAEASLGEALEESRSWVATGVPSQLYRSAAGTLENPKFAEVLNFADEVEKRDDQSAFNTDTASINLDEILRRRRSNG
jgi:hypothetical protein